MELVAHRLLLVLTSSLRVERDRLVEVEGRGVEERGEQLDRERRREKKGRKKMVVVRMTPVKAGMMSSGK